MAAYYTLASAGIPLSSLPNEFARKLPRYPVIPAVRIGRLGVDSRFQGQGLGGAMLADALQRVIASAAAAYALLVDAKNERAIEFYRRHGFIGLVDRPSVLFLPIATALKVGRRASP